MYLGIALRAGPNCLAGRIRPGGRKFPTPDLKHRLQTGFVVSVGLPLLSATLTKYFHISLRASAFSTSLGRSTRSTHATFSHVCLTLHCDCLSLWNHAHSVCRQWGSREAAHRHTAPLSHKVHKVPILIKREKVLFLTAGYCGTFLVSVYHATLTRTCNMLCHRCWSKATACNQRYLKSLHFNKARYLKESQSKLILLFDTGHRSVSNINRVYDGLSINDSCLRNWLAGFIMSGKVR